MSICPPQSSDQVLYAGIITLYPKIIQRTRLVFPVSPGCRMTKSYHHPVCNLVHSVFCPIIGRFSQINWEFPTLLPLRLCFVLCFSTYRCDMPRSGFMGYFPWSYPRPQMRFGKVASFSGSYGFVPMKWVPQLNDIRISLPEFRGRSPTLILMLYVNELYVYCPSQSSVQDLYAGIIQLYPKINLEREIGFPVFFFGCRMPKSYSVSAWIWFIHRWLVSWSRRLKFFWEFC